MELLLQLLMFRLLVYNPHLGRLNFIQMDYCQLLRLARALPLAFWCIQDKDERAIKTW